MYDQPEYVEEAVRAGAAGYLVKNATKKELSRAVVGSRSPQKRSL